MARASRVAAPAPRLRRWLVLAAAVGAVAVGGAWALVGFSNGRGASRPTGSLAPAPTLVVSAAARAAAALPLTDLGAETPKGPRLEPPPAPSATVGRQPLATPEPSEEPQAEAAPEPPEEPQAEATPAEVPIIAGAAPPPLDRPAVPTRAASALRPTLARPAPPDEAVATAPAPTRADPDPPESANPPLSDGDPSAPSDRVPDDAVIRTLALADLLQSTLPMADSSPTPVPPSVTGEATCTETGEATFIIHGAGGTSSPWTYTLSQGSREIRSNAFSARAGATTTITAQGYYGSLVLKVTPPGEAERHLAETFCLPPTPPRR